MAFNVSIMMKFKVPCRQGEVLICLLVLLHIKDQQTHIICTDYKGKDNTQMAVSVRMQLWLTISVYKGMTGL